jgi:hypothetical protein
MKNKKISPLLLWGSVLVFGLVGLFVLGGFKLPIGFAGGNVISLGEVNVESGNPNIPAGRVWQALLSLNGENGQTLLMKTASTTELKSATDPETPTIPVEFKFQLNSEKISYGLDQTGFYDLYNVTMTPKTFSMTFYGSLGNCVYTINGAVGAYQGMNVQCGIGVTPPTETEFVNAYLLSCPGTPLTKVVSLNPGTRTEWYCYYIGKQSIGKVYSIINPSVAWTASFSVTPQGKATESVSLNSANALQGVLSSQSKIFVKWVGNTVANDIIPLGAYPDVMVDANGNYFKVSNGMKFYAQNNPDPQNTFRSSGADLATIISRVNTYNTYVGMTKITNPSTYNPKFATASFFFGHLDVDASATPYYYPNFQIFSDAAWMGIKISMPKPVIVNVQPVSFQVGSGSANVFTTLRNDGDAGAFDVSISCPSPLSASGGVQRQGFTAGEQRVVTVGITSGQVATQTCVSCTLTASDSNDATNKATAQFQACATPACNLQPYGNWVVVTNPSTGQCSYACGLTSCAGGQNLDSIQCTCTGSSTPTPTQPPLSCSDGTAYNVCSVATPGNRCVNGGLVRDVSCDQQQQDNTLLYVLGGIVVVLVLAFAYMQFGGKKGKKRR